MEASVERIQTGIEMLNQFNSTKEDGAGTTRILFTQEELKARDYIKQLMRQTGLDVEEDAIGNIFGILQGSESTLPCVWSGSHIDTVCHAGMFDGMAGVIGAIEALRVIKESEQCHRRDIKAIVFTSEEPTRFGLCCLGSRAMAGRLKRDDLAKIVDEESQSLEQVLLTLGYNLLEYQKIEKNQTEVFASVELHIEQGAVLEQLGKPIGIVEAICAPTNLEVTIKGVQEHAGSTPMPIRHDALVAAAEIILAVEQLAKETDSVNTVATVGKLNVYPNVTNAIPGEVNLTIDLRDSVMKIKENVLEKVLCLFDEVMKKTGVTISYTVANHDVPQQCNEKINHIIEETCQNEKIEYHRMVSGAYHDSIFVAEFAPTSMIFVPSKDGLSHNPKEWTDYKDIKIGVDILAETLLKLAK